MGFINDHYALFVYRLGQWVFNPLRRVRFSHRVPYMPTTSASVSCCSIPKGQSMGSALLCLSLAIYHEARGESTRGMFAVAEVVINRTEEMEKSICDVVYQSHQFSWTRRHGRNVPPDSEAWRKSKEIASQSLKTKTNYTGGSLFFNTRSIGVRFGRSKKAEIGNHIFF